MTYKLTCNESALREWKNWVIPFKKKLAEHLQNPRVSASQLHCGKDQYKIKLRGAGYRLVYSANDDIVTVIAIGVSKRENDDIYSCNPTQKLIALDTCLPSYQSPLSSGAFWRLYLLMALCPTGCSGQLQLLT